jgi:CPA2 family monovalent cation:H+ antiporter-2
MIWVARHGSEEAFLLTSLTIILVSAAGFHALGVSPALGAFLAGMVLGESDFRHHMEEKIHPFRDVLVGIFFVTIGLQLDVGLIMSEPFKIALWLVVLVPAKMMLNTLALRLSGLSTTDAVRTGLILGHGGEFALLMLVMAMQMSVLEVSQGQPLLVALVLSMAVAPIIIKHHARIGKLFSAPSVKERPQKEELDAAELSEQLKQHAIICGAGKVGLVVCQMLSEARRPYILIESSYEAYLAALQQGYPVIYGDASRSATLKAAGIKRAALLVVTFSATKPIERLLNWLGKDCPDLPLVVSTDNDRLFQVYRDKHPVYTFIEPLAAGTALAEKVLALMGVSESEARLRADAIRSLDAPESI